MKAKQIHDMKTDELIEKLGDLKKDLFMLRFSHTTRQLENPMKMAECKKDIARVKTILRQREIASDKKGAGDK